VPGKTSIIRLENKSKGGRKPWADVLVVECQRCGLERRYPVGQERQCKKKDRTVVQVNGQTCSFKAVEGKVVCCGFLLLEIARLLRVLVLSIGRK